MVPHVGLLLELGVVDSVAGGVRLEGEGLVQGSLQLEVHVEVLVVASSGC